MKKVQGFSLVEVVIALGVVAFAVVAILGIFPLALGSGRSGVNEARAAQLVRAITGTIDAQSATFGSVNCYGSSLDLTKLKKGDAAVTLYATYTEPGQPTISSVSSPDAIYSIELRFDNNPPILPAVATAAKINLIEIRVYGKSQSEGNMEFFYLARDKS